MNWINFFLIIVALLLTIVGVERWRRLALRRHHLDIPNDRSSHTIPTPRGGGVVIFLVTFVFLAFGAWQSGFLLFLIPFLIGAALIAVISWLDDLYTLPSGLRFFVHALGALIVILNIGYFQIVELPFLSINLDENRLGQIITLLWIVGLTNAYNFMDGIDGIAGTQGLIAGVGWSAAGLILNQPLIVLFGGLIAAACIGFLRHNWHPARIFMGDVGSAFLGFSLAVMPILALRISAENSHRFVVIGVLLVWTFVFDAIFTFIKRALRRENVFAAHRSHLYQRLVIAGFRHDTVTLIYGGLSVLGAATAVAIWLSQSEIRHRFVLWFVLLFPLLLWAFVTFIEKKRKQTAN